MTSHTTSDERCRMVFGLAVCCLLFAMPTLGEAQNLVPNPSFELQDTCPYIIGFQGNAKPLYWDKWNESPEYFDACIPGLGQDSLIDLPQNGFGFQYALEGDAYVGLYAYGSSVGGVSFREYVGCQLNQPLEVGETYNLSFFTNVAVGGSYWWTRWASSHMGMLFTMQPNLWTDVDQPPFALRNYAHLHSTTVINDSINWTLVSGSFVADSAYAYLVIGNFFSNAVTDTLHLVPGPSLGAYYFVDGVCVTRVDEECSFPTTVGEGHVRVPHVWPNPVMDYLHVRVEAGSTWQVFEPTGRLVDAGLSSDGVLSIPVRDWPQGQYLFQAQGETKRQVHFVVIR